MAAPSAGTKKLVKTRLIGFAVVMLILLGVSYALMPSVAFTSFTAVTSAPIYPICADGDGKIVRVEQSVVRIPIRRECWSAWIQLRPRKRFRVDTPGEVEIWFWNEKRLLVADKNPRWLATIPSSTFRIRGKTGTAVIYEE